MSLRSESREVPANGALEGDDRIRTGVRRFCARTRTDATATVYFVREGDYGPIKIGTAADPHGRLRSLQVGNPCELHLLASIEAPLGLERWLHNSLAADRVTGEWFAPTDEVLETVAEFVAHYGAISCPECDRLALRDELGMRPDRAAVHRHNCGFRYAEAVPS